MAKTGTIVRTGMYKEDSCVRFVISYTKRRIVQGHRVHYLVSIVNILSQGKVQRVKPTYPMQVSTVEVYHQFYPVFGGQFYSCGELLEKWLKTIYKTKFNLSGMHLKIM